MRSHKTGDLVKRRGIMTENPVLGVVLGWDDILDLVKVRWSSPDDIWEEGIGLHEEDLEHPEMLETVYRPEGVARLINAKKS